MAGETPKGETTPKKTPSELMANAKIQVSGAATDVVHAVKSYGKPDGESGVGHYVGKAEDYLHQLRSPSDQPQPTAASADEGAEKKAESVVVAAESAEKKVEPVVVAADEPEGGGKKAESAAVEGGEKKDDSTGGFGGLINKAKEAEPEGGGKKAESAAVEGGGKKAESAAVEGGEKKDDSTGGFGGLINKAKGLFK